MPDLQKNYSLFEVARIIGVDEKKVNVYTHEGLIGLVHPNENSAFSEIDCIRLKVIKRADELGYHHEEIKHLIGPAEDFTNNDDPLIYYKKFAIKRYKKLFKELDQCEPLEQVKRQCDLRLILNYIQELDAIQTKPSGNLNDDNGGSSPKVQAVQDIFQKLPAINGEISSAVQSTTISRSGDVAHPVRRRFPAFRFFKPFWVVAILAIALVVTTLITLLKFSPNVNTLEGPALPTPLPHLQSQEKDSTTKSKKEERLFPIKAQPRTEKATKPIDSNKVDKIPPMPTSAADTKQRELNPVKQALVDETPSITPMTTINENSSVPDDLQHPIVSVEDFVLMHDGPGKKYRAEFKIVKNHTIGGSQAVSGYAFVKFQTGGDHTSQEGMIMPAVEFSSGKPRWLPRAGQFIINNFKPMILETQSSIPPDKINSVQILIYSSNSELLLDRLFPPIIQPYTGGPEQRQPVANDNDNISTPKMAISPATSEFSSSKNAPDSEKSSQKVFEADEPLAVKPNKTDNPEAVVWEQRSYDAAMQGYFDRAIADASKAIELDPGRTNPYITRSWAYIERGMPEKAIQDAITALSIDPTNPYALNNLGLAYQRKYDLAKAKDYYQKACRLGLETGCDNLKMLTDQSRLQQLIDKSQTAFKNGDWQNAIRAATEAIELDPQNAVALTNRSAAYAQLNSLKQALKDANDAIKYDPQFPLAYNNRGYVYQLMGDNEKAAADYLRSCSLGLALGCKNFESFSDSP